MFDKEMVQTLTNREQEYLLEYTRERQSMGGEKKERKKERKKVNVE